MASDCLVFMGDQTSSPCCLSLIPVSGGLYRLLLVHYDAGTKETEL